MKRAILITLIVTSSIQLFAQKSRFVISYPIAFPVDHLSSYINKTSFRGISIEYNWVQARNLEVGFEAGWNVFYKKEEEKTYNEKTVSITGIQYRYANITPLLAGAKIYHSTGNPNLTAFYGLGLGTMYIEQLADFGLYAISKKTWQFCLRPEGGIKYKATESVSGFVGLKYYGGFGNSELEGQQYATVNIGLIFMSF